MHIVGRFLAVAFVVPVVGAAQSPFQASLLVPRSDSFTISANGRVVGHSVETLRTTGEGFELTNSTSVGRMTQRTRVTFTKALVMQRVEQEGTAGGQAMSIDVVYANGRAKGRAVTPGPSGMKAIAIDTTVPGEAVDDNVLQVLLPSLELRDGASHVLRVFASGQGELREVKASVGALASLTVPAGVFQAYPVTVTGLAVPVVFHVTADAPRRVVSVTPTGSPMKFELAR
jgi:hypothetical protein